MNTILVIVFMSVIIDGKDYTEVWWRDMKTEARCEQMLAKVKKARPNVPAYCTDKPPVVNKNVRG